MKTLKELNSKWYWRLLKVIWVIILIPIFLVSILISYGEVHKLNEEYSPDRISNANLKLNDYKNLLEDLKELKVVQNKILTIIPELVEFIPRDDYDGPDGSAYYMVSRKMIKENLLQINSILGDKEKIFFVIIGYNGGYNFEGVGINYDRTGINFSENDSPIFYPKGTTFDEYLDGKDIEIDSSYGKYSTEFIEKDIGILEYNITAMSLLLKDVIEGNEHNSLSMVFDDKVRNDMNSIIGNKDYISFSGWIKIIFSLLGIAITLIFILLLISLLSRGILYYIILGRFNPKE